MTPKPDAGDRGKSWAGQELDTGPPRVLIVCSLSEALVWPNLTKCFKVPSFFYSGVIRTQVFLLLFK